MTTDATNAVAGWRCPTELQHAVAEVVDDAVRWLEEPRWAGTGQASRPSDGRRSGSWQAPDADLRDEMRRMAEELRVQRIERVVDLMQRWPAFVDGVVSASTLGERRSWLRCCYDVYVALRDMQKDLRVAGRVRSDDEARLYLHTCRALVDVADFIRAVQTPLGRSYSMKDPHWLRAQVDPAWRTLRVRGVAAGRPPWPPTESRMKPAHGADQADPAASETTSQTARKPTAEGRDQSHGPDAAAYTGITVQAASPSALLGAGPTAWVVLALVVAITLFAGWTGRRAIGEALGAAAAIAAVVAVGVLLIRSEAARRATGMMLIATLKLAGFVLVLTVKMLAGVVGLLIRRP